MNYMAKSSKFLFLVSYFETFFFNWKTSHIYLLLTTYNLFYPCCL